MIDARYLFERFRHKVQANPRQYYADYLVVKEKVRQAPMRYMDKPVDFLYQPMFFTASDVQRFTALTALTCTILRKITGEYLSNPAYRRLFRFPALMEELMLVDPQYAMPFPMARFDIFYPYTDHFMFCEINSDGTSGMQESTVLDQIFSTSQALANLGDRSHFAGFELFESWIDALLANYRAFGGWQPNPALAIVDFDGEGMITEFQEFRRRMEQRELPVVICDPRELRYKNGGLFYNNRRIDLVYRRATTARIVEEAGDVQDLLNAYRDHAVCMVGGLVSQIIHNKALFAVLHHPVGRKPLNEEEARFVERHFPWTAFLDPVPRLLRQVKNNKDQLVLKPLDRYAGSGVYIGRECSPADWEARVEEAAAGGAYLVQELCPVPQLKMPTADRGTLYLEDYYYLTGLYIYNEVFRGLYSRAGRRGVIASIAESYSLPNFIVTP